MTQGLSCTGRVAAAGLVALWAAARPCGPLAAQSRLWRPEERAVISDFSSVEAVAASPFLVFAATTHGLTIYDRRARAWRPPVTALDGYPSARVRVALADALGDAVWLGTDEGWARYDAAAQRWDRGATPGGVANFAFDARDQASGLFLLTGAGWSFLPRGALFPVPGRPLPPPGQRVQPLDPQTALRLAPMAEAMRALILSDPRLGTHRYTAAARTRDQNDLFLGTNGLGLVRVDATTAEWERLPFGLLAPRVGAVARSAGGVWVTAVARAGEPRGLTWVAADLSADTLVQGPGTLGFACLEGRRLLVRGRFLWVGCERGVEQIEGGSYRSVLFDQGRGLPSDQVLSLAAAPDGAWIGTNRGLAIITDDAKVVPLRAVTQPVLSLLAVGESLWVGTSAGLGVVVPGSAGVAIPADVAEQPALRAPIVALTRLRGGDTLVVVTADQLAWRDAERRWTLLRVGADLGEITVAAGDAGGAWLGGTLGLAFWDVGHGTFRALRVPGDLPAAVRDIAVDDPYLWVGTDSGLVRFTLTAARGR